MPIDLCRSAIWRAAALLSLVLPAGLWADTVHLENGAEIKECRVVEDADGRLVLRTPSGPMVVPKEMVSDVEKKPCIFDAYDEKYAKVKQDDASALIELARWCREKAGLREEMETLIEKVLKLDADHAGARRMLGFLHDGEKWVQLPLLYVTLKPRTDEPIPETVRAFLANFTSRRSDVKVLAEPTEAAPAGVETCTFITQVTTRKTKGAKFYGKKISGPVQLAAIELTVQGAPFASGLPSATLEGEAKASLPEARTQAIDDALSRSAGELHSFLDAIQERRLTLFEASIAAKRSPSPPAPPGESEKSGKPGKS